LQIIQKRDLGQGHFKVYDILRESNSSEVSNVAFRRKVNHARAECLYDEQTVN
jgi:hypothetical protein